MARHKSNPFAKSEGRRVKISNQQKRQIRNLYNDVAKEIDERLIYYSGKNTATGYLRTLQLNDLKNSIQNNMQYVDSSTERIIRSNMLKMSQIVLDDNEALLKAMGFIDTRYRFAYVPRDIVNQLVSGKLYGDNWSLSKSIWEDNARKSHEIDSIVAKGIAENKSTFEIAKDLERYVKPNALKPWDWSKVYPGTRRVIDYNAQRLARTMVSHAYEESFVRSTKENPFIDAYQWLSSGGDRMCDLCAERDGKIFAKDELPLDHPNGMCTFMIEMQKSYNEIAMDLANWVNGEGNPELNAKIDNFANDLYNRNVITRGTRINDRGSLVNNHINNIAKR